MPWRSPSPHLPPLCTDAARPALGTPQVTKAVAKIALTSPKPALTPLGEANRDEAAAPPAAQQPVLGFGNDEEDF